MPALSKSFIFVCTFLILTFLFSVKSEALRIYNTGSSRDIKTKTTSYLCLAGGGDDDLWAHGWKNMLENAGGGDIVIIRADGERGGYESWIYNDDSHNHFPAVNSVKTIVIENPNDANSPDVYKFILQAELVFFAGGDQSLYINWFRHSRLEAAVNDVMKTKKIVIGGTSAGMALLAGIDFRAQYSSPNPQNDLVTAEDVLKNPTGKFVDLDNEVFVPPFMKNVITDTHFSERQREARLLAFMARAVYNGYRGVHAKNIKGIGADEGTALCYDSNGKSSAYGAGKIYFLIGNANIEQIKAGASLNWYAKNQAVLTYIIQEQPNAFFDLKNWSGQGGYFENWWVDGHTNPENPIFGRK